MSCFYRQTVQCFSTSSSPKISNIKNNTRKEHSFRIFSNGTGSVSPENSSLPKTHYKQIWLFYSIVANELRIIYGSIRGVKVSCRTRSSVESLSKTRTPLVLHSFNFYQELPKISYVLKIFPTILSKFRSDICQELSFITIFSELSSIEILIFWGFRNPLNFQFWTIYPGTSKLISGFLTTNRA